MPVHAETRVLPHPARDVFDIVADIESYPEFVPLCTETKVRRDGRQDGRESLMAEMEISFRITRFRTESKIVLDPGGLSILISNVDAQSNPLKRMESRWLFSELGPGRCRIEFQVDFEFKSRTLEKLFGGAFRKVNERIVSAFVKRAEELCG